MEWIWTDGTWRLDAGGNFVVIRARNRKHYLAVWNDQRLLHGSPFRVLMEAQQAAERALIGRSDDHHPQRIKER